MQTVKSIWDFFQTELLGMSWLNRLIGDLLNACGLDTAGKVGGSVQFFIYDTIKIMVLLGVLILIISYIQSYFPPEKVVGYGAMSMPALVVNEKVVAMGKVLKAADVEKLLHKLGF